LHDNALSEYILSEKPGEDQEINLVTHCMFGQRNVQALPFKTEIDGYVKYHHERADGKGPFGKKEGEFPEEVAIIAIADAVDARDRLQFYPAGELDALRERIRRHTGSRYTGQAAAAMLAVLDEAMLQSLRDDIVFGTFAEHMPVWEVELTDMAIMGIAGITAKIIDYKSEFTRNHSVQISNISWLMAERYGFSEENRAKMYLAAALHDLGKLKVPVKILEKPGKLTDEEFAVIKKHPRWTYEMLENIGGFEKINHIASNHHEKLDGSGYARGLAAKELDLPMRMITCADIYQAVSESRPYHPARDHGETMEILYAMVREGKLDGKIVADMDDALREYSQDVPSPPGAVV
jgi:HD-GYP domain-containing protein (c-di-GMP phosphodiesterase class II)